MNAYMRYASAKAPSKLQCEILQHNVSARMCDMKNEERALLLKKNGKLEIIGKRLINGGA